MRLRTQEEFLAEVNSRIGDIGPLDPKDSAGGFPSAGAEYPAGDIGELKHLLPEDIRRIFDGGGQAIQ